MDPVQEFLLIKRGALKKCSGCGKMAEVGSDGKCAGCGGGKPKMGAVRKCSACGKHGACGPNGKCAGCGGMPKAGAWSQTDVAKVEAVKDQIKQTKGMTVPQRKAVMKEVGKAIPNQQKTASLKEMALVVGRAMAEYELEKLGLGPEVKGLQRLQGLQDLRSQWARKTMGGIGQRAAPVSSLVERLKQIKPKFIGSSLPRFVRVPL